MAARFLIFDCETTGLPTRRGASPRDVDVWPRLIQLAWGTFDARGKTKGIRSHIIRPEGFRIPADATAVHGISHARAVRTGKALDDVLDEFLKEMIRPGIFLVAHHLAFDLGVVGAELVRSNKPLGILDLPGLCTMETTAGLCRLPRWGGAGFKWPTLEELHAHLFGSPYDRPHDAASDLEACARCFFKLFEEGYYSLPDD